MENSQNISSDLHCRHERSNMVNFIDLNREPDDEICELENNFVVDLAKECESGVVVGIDSQDRNSCKNSFEPFIGQCFLSDEEAYKFYENFARNNGFSIRKGRFINKNGKMIRRDFFCHRQGFANKKFVEPTKEQRNRPSSRCGCKAAMRVTLKKSNDIFPEEWHVTHFTSHHNHELLSPMQVRFLPSYRTISKEDEKDLVLYKDAGLSVKQIMRVMELQKNVKHGDLPFLHKDVHNFLSRIRRKNLDNDAMDLLAYCKSVKIENHNFQFDYTVDAENRLENILWFPSHCFDLYQEYGDCIGLDTRSMDDKGNLDGNVIYKACILYMAHYLLYRLDNIEDFEREWPLVVSKFNLQENKHVRGLYEIKRNWVPAYLRDYFFGGMTTTGRCESINSFVKRFTSSRSHLTQLIKQVDLAVEDIGQSQIRYTMLDTYRGSSLRTLSPLEDQVYKLFTAFSFKKFQEEFERATQYTVCEEDNSIFIVQHYKEAHTQKHNVTWNNETVSCSCKIFEFWGILCRHVLPVFIHKDCFEIPMEYLPLRWRRDEFHVVGVGVSMVSQMMTNWGKLQIWSQEIGSKTVLVPRF